MQRNENRSELQDRIATELREKARAREEAKAKMMDGVEDVKFLHDTKKTTSLAGVWIAIIIAIVVLTLFFIFSGN